jgi:hypothetical protein
MKPHFCELINSLYLAPRPGLVKARTKSDQVELLFRLAKLQEEQIP